MHVPGAGDFLLSLISGPPEPQCANEDAAAAAARNRQLGAGAGAMDAEGAGAAQPAVLARADPAAQEGSLDRENVPDPLAGEQTWPTQEVRPACPLAGLPLQLLLPLQSFLEAAESGGRTWRHLCALSPQMHLQGRSPAASCAHPCQHCCLPLQEVMEAEVTRVQAKALRKRRLPKGTSDYQAAWILDDDDARSGRTHCLHLTAL